MAKPISTCAIAPSATPDGEAAEPPQSTTAGGSAADKPGYHLTPIAKGKLGELSKIIEEVEELRDAEAQRCKIMQAVELADLYGAIEHYARQQLNLTMEDVITMTRITERAFKNGRR